MTRFSYIFCRLAAAVSRWSALFCVACLSAGAFLCVIYLRGHAVAEVAGLVLLGAAVSVPVAMLCVAISQKAAIWILDEEVRKEMEKARKEREEEYQQRLTRFLENCIEEEGDEGDTPVWKSRHEQ